MSLSKNTKMNILNSAIEYLNKDGRGMCIALINSIFYEISPYADVESILMDDFPEFNEVSYNAFYNRYGGTYRTNLYWDTLNSEGKQRRIQFLEHLKTTV